MTSRPSRIVIYRLGSLGDTIVALPCFHKIAQVFPDAERLVLTNFPISRKAAPLEAVLGGSGLIHRTIPYPMGTRSPAVLWHLASQLRATGSDTMVYLTPPRGLGVTFRDKLYFRSCGFKRIIGAPDTRDLQANRIMADGTLERESSRLARCLASLGPIDLDDLVNWDMRLTEAEKAVGAKTISPFGSKPYIAINMGGKDPSKDWGVENWTQLLTRLGRARPGIGLLVVGAGEDAARVTQVTQEWPSEIVNACGQLSPRESGAALAKAAMFVGHDSGPLHLAAVMGVYCVGLFGSLNIPKKWYPVGEQHTILHDRSGIAAISVEQVFGTVLPQLLPV